MFWEDRWPNCDLKIGTQLGLSIHAKTEKVENRFTNLPKYVQELKIGQYRGGHSYFRIGNAHARVDRDKYVPNGCASPIVAHREIRT